MKKADYKEIEEEVQKVCEPAACYQATSRMAIGTHSDSKYAFMQEFAYSNYDKDEAQALESKNFMIGQPFEYDTIESSEDWERITREAEASGIATDHEVEKVFQRWHNL